MDGHELEPQKCVLWIPALDHVATEDTPMELQQYWNTYQRGRHHVVALGTTAGGPVRDSYRCRSRGLFGPCGGKKEDVSKAVGQAAAHD